MMDPLPVVDGLTLPAEVRALLRPGEPMADYEGRIHILPRYFYRVADWNLAKATKLTPYFTLAELMTVDCREADPLLRVFPHYVPCAISLLARYLAEFRSRAGAAVSVSVNGGYRSPSHAYSTAASPHLWGTAANIYRVGDSLLDSQKLIEKYSAVAHEIGQEVFTKPYGTAPGHADDHLHFDIGYVHWVPREMAEVTEPAEPAVEIAAAPSLIVANALSAAGEAPGA
jgi:hypothetical protein